MKLETLAQVLNRDDVRSQVMKDGAFFDAFLGVTIAIYFTKQERLHEFHQLIIERLNFDEKIRVLEKLKYKKVYKSIEAFPVIREVQQIRNLLAHEYYIHHAHKKLHGAKWAYLFADYPKSYLKPVQTARQRLARLAGTKEFMEVYSQ